MALMMRWSSRVYRYDEVFYVQPLERKYIRVSGEATIRHVELFIRRKMELSPNLKVVYCIIYGMCCIALHKQLSSSLQFI